MAQESAEEKGRTNYLALREDIRGGNMVQTTKMTRK